MKIALNFKDGMQYVTELGDIFRVQQSPGLDLLSLLQTGKEKNSAINLNNKDGTSVQRHYDELHSVEIIME